MLSLYFCIDVSLLNITGFDACMLDLFFGVSRADLQDGAIDKIRNVSNLGALTNRYQFVVLP